jgi:hypothetical protein
MEPDRSKEDRAIQAAQELLHSALRVGAEQIYLLPDDGGNYRCFMIAAGEEVLPRLISAGDGLALLNRLKLMGGVDLATQDGVQEGYMFFPQEENGKEWYMLSKPSPAGEQLIVSVTEDLKEAPCADKSAQSAQEKSSPDESIYDLRFAFREELFDFKRRAQEALETNGILLHQSYQSIDLNHQEFGLEVCAIVDENTAIRISRILSHTFPEWDYVIRFMKDVGPEAGWKVKIQQMPDQ